MYQHPSYHADATILFGTQVENTDLFPQQATLAQQWDNVYAYPHIQYSGFHAALQNIAKQFGNDIPTVSGDGGPYWEDGIAADAYSAALERQNEARATFSGRTRHSDVTGQPQVRRRHVEPASHVDKHDPGGRAHLGLV